VFQDLGHLVLQCTREAEAGAKMNEFDGEQTVSCQL